MVLSGVVWLLAGSRFLSGLVFGLACLVWLLVLTGIWFGFSVGLGSCLVLSGFLSSLASCLVWTGLWAGLVYGLGWF